MSSYFDFDDVERRLRGDLEALYELPGERAELDQDVEDVEAEVNAFVGKRYAVPVTSARAVAYLKKLCLDVFAETAWARGVGSELPEKVRKAAATARAQLEKIAKGVITLGGATSLQERPVGGAESIIVDGNDPEFTRDQMGGF